MEAAPDIVGVATFVTWSSTPARGNTVANPCDIQMNMNGVWLNVL
jgi:hypothetical protein